MLMIDLFCGRGGATKGFLAEGWECIGYDINPQPLYPASFVQRDILTMDEHDLALADFVWASSPCEEYAMWGMRHFHPNPKPPEMGLKLFRHTEHICIASGKAFVMENVRAAQQFVGKSVNHCGPFHFWGNAVPAIMPKELYQVTKGFGAWDRQYILTTGSSKSKRRQELKSQWAEIPIVISQYIAQCVTKMVNA